MSRSRPKKYPTRRSNKAYPTGVIHVTPAGYGFVHTAEGEFFVPASKTADAFDGDTVEFSLIHEDHKRKGKQSRSGNSQRLTARVVRVTNRAYETLVGSYEVCAPFGVVIPQDPCIHHDIFTPHDPEGDIQDGDIVRVRIESYPNRREPAFGVVEEVLGHEGIEGIDIELIISKYKLETHFSDKVLAEAEKADVKANDALLHDGYRDLRERAIFTIDPADAKDFDDALSFERVGKYRRLGVHIADVSYYVPWGSAIDVEARKRATSTYLVDRVIPMLPEKLCNEVCSLQPHVDRRSLTVDMYFDDHARVHHIDVYPALISSCARFAYEQVQEYLDGKVAHIDESLEREDEALIAIKEIDALAHELFAARLKRGGMDFDGVEARVILDSKGVPFDIMMREKTDATSLVEESMIAANEAIARFLVDSEMPSVFRVHDLPESDGLTGLVPLLQEFGYTKSLSLSEFVSGNPFEIQKVLELSQGRPEEYLMSSLVLRCMQRAVYRPVCAPHFGLASEAYTHFTSPIRRYPDLIVHRMVKMAIGKKTETYQQQVDMLGFLAEHSSKMERNAEAASRDSQELKMLEYMERFIGQEYDGIISGVMASGFFVQLPNTAEGFVPLRTAGEYFIFDATKHQLIGSDTGRMYRLGQRVRVCIQSVKPFERRMDFSLVISR